MISRMALPMIVGALIVSTASFDALARTSLRYVQDDNATGTHGIDLGRFCKQISALTTDQQLRTKAEAVIAHLSTSVISNYVGFLRQDIYKYGSNGLAIYFPESRTLYALDPYQGGYRESTDEKFPVEFVKSHRWDNFLHTYFEHVQ